MAHTLHVSRTLKVRNLASLKVLGRFRARKALVKLPRARSPGFPGHSRRQGPSPRLQARGTHLGLECVSVSVKRGEVPRQIPQRVGWIGEWMRKVKSGAPDTKQLSSQEQ